MDVLLDLTEVAHVEPLIAAGTFNEMVCFGLGNAIGVDAIVAGQPVPRERILRLRSFGFSPSSSHLRATSSVDRERQRNSAASLIELLLSMSALRPSISISVQSAPS